MQTRCPECQTAFLITEQQLNAAGGKARCGRCGAVFDARAALLPEPGAEPAVAKEAEIERPLEADSAPAATEPVTEPEAAAGPSPAPSSSAEALEFATQFEDRTPAPIPRQDDEVPAVLLEDLAAIQGPKRRRYGWAWSLLIVLLSALLVVQYAYFMRAELVSRYPQTRPWLAQMCTVLSKMIPCDVPLARNVSQLRMLASEVTEHPSKTGALLIQATFVNTAPFNQPFPVLEVKLSDLRNQPVALRRFQPKEYLPSDTNIERGMVPRTPVTAVIEVARPFADVNNYRFTFH